LKNRIKEITADMEKTGGATEQSLDKLSAHFGVELPAAYVEFMRATNGADGPIGNIEYLQIWTVEKVIELNRGRVDIKEEHPDWLFFAGMGSGSDYAYDTRYQPMPVVEVDMIDPDNNEVRGGSFEEFLENLYKTEE
jgi:hypothetical protein